MFVPGRSLVRSANMVTLNRIKIGTTSLTRIICVLLVASDYSKSNSRLIRTLKYLAKMKTYFRHSLWIIFTLLFNNLGFAQAPAPTPVYTGSFGGGLAVTNGNTDTTNFNLAFSLIRDPKTKNLTKATALYLRGSQNDVLSLDRSTVVLRHEYSLTTRTFVFGQLDYIRDKFKDIRYLVAPGGGLGYRLINSEETKLSVSGGAGGLWEKNSTRLKKTGSVNAGQSFSHRLSSTATFTESIGSLWNTDDFEDSLTNFALGVTTSIIGNLELKFEFLDSYKNKPSNPAIKKNDTAFVTTIVLKF
jgi:putative salt-induced outer membrane protein